MTKRKLFLIALAAGNENWSSFAERHGITEQGLQRIVNGISRSRRIEKIVDAYIDRKFRKLRLVIGIGKENERAARNGDRFKRAESLSAQI